MSSDDDTSTVGNYIRRQREMQDLTMRQLADLVGISNPYLSQIERGLRDPSERVLDAIAQNLSVSAETLHEYSTRRHGHADPEAEAAVVAAIRADPHLTRPQRQALLEVYALFRQGTQRARD